MTTRELKIHYEGRDEFKLGCMLFDQQKYSEAEEQLRKAVEEQERIHNGNNGALSSSKYLLGRTLYMQQNFSEAEAFLRQALDWLENTSTEDFIDTLYCRLLLGRTLYSQQKYSEAEEQLRQAVDGQGRDDVVAVNTKYFLGRVLYDQQKYGEAEEQLRQAIDGQENILGRDHEHTLNCRMLLGRTMYEQQRYSDAKEMLIRATDETEKTLSKDHENTLGGRYLLGRVLYVQQKYSEAENQLQQAADGQEKKLSIYCRATLTSKFFLGLTHFNLQRYGEAKELLARVADISAKTFGEDDQDTLSSKYQLGYIFYIRKEYREAEEPLQQAADGRERTLGLDHKDTLDSKCILGRTLYEQQKYDSAERPLQQVADGRERTLGLDHKDTLYSKCILGRTLHWQQKCDDAEGPLRQAADGRERILGLDHKDTLHSKHMLGLTLCSQQKYNEAEVLLQQAADGRKKTLGPCHSDTLYSKSWLQLALLQRMNSHMGESGQQGSDAQRRTLGKDHEANLATFRLSQEVQQNPYPSFPTGNTPQQALVDGLSSFFLEGMDRRNSYSDSEISEISRLLEHSNLGWSRVPRTYIVLRTIGHLDLLDDLINLGFSDYWFPVTRKTIQHFLRPNIRTEFLGAQRLVLTQSIALEKGKDGQHYYYKLDQPLPFEKQGILGNGGFGQVDKVLSQIDFREYARKRVLRSVAFRGRSLEDMKRFIAEIQILKRLKHRHIVEFISSYTDPKYIGLIMSPVAEMDLSTYLKRAKDSHFPELRSFFGCLATAVEFLHMEDVRHKDIKPGNILVHRGNILFTDFGLALDYTDASGSTTTGLGNGKTPRYCAPEVAQYQPRNTASDIWSLGVVFMEMIVVLKGRTTQYMDEFFRQHGSHQVFIRTNSDALSEFIKDLEGIGDLLDNRALSWTQRMLSTEQQLRPTAASLVTSIIATIEEEGAGAFCGICCIAPEEEDFSGWEDE